jgi:hypothetical protein
MKKQEQGKNGHGKSTRDKEADKQGNYQYCATLSVCGLQQSGTPFFFFSLFSEYGKVVLLGHFALWQ